MARRPGPALSRDDVIAAAADLVNTEGPDALGVSRVAQLLGIKPPSIYNHVGKGDALAQAVSFAAQRSLIDALQHATRAPATPTEALRILAWATRAWVRQNAGLYALMSRRTPPLEHPEFMPINRDLLALFQGPLSRLGLPPEQHIHAIRALRSAIHGFVLLEASGQFQLQQDPDESYRLMVDLLLRGLTPGVGLTPSTPP